MQDLLEQAKQELLSTTRLPMAVDFLLAELRHADSALARVLEEEEQGEQASGDGGEQVPELELAPPEQSGNPQENPQGNA